MRNLKNESSEDCEPVAYHETGHALITEILEPNIVTIVSTGGHENSSLRGFTAFYRSKMYWRSSDLMKNRVMCLLGGKCATEIKYGKRAVGCTEDLRRAYSVLSKFVIDYTENGFDKFLPSSYNSDMLRFNQENAINAEMARYYRLTKQIMIENRELLDALAIELQQKKVIKFKRYSKNYETKLVVQNINV